MKSSLSTTDEREERVLCRHHEIVVAVEISYFIERESSHER
ncbi:MAG: hypothetical protein OSB12_00120 [Planctomycetota bacterium]|nr:hypothetical protein [Planctomycetota bacterium]